MYKGESVGQVCDRIRLEIMRPSRHQWTDKEFHTILSRQGNICECGVELTKQNAEIDHTIRLCDGGEDTINNAVAKCNTCHAEKSETERLGENYTKQLEVNYRNQSETVTFGELEEARERCMMWIAANKDNFAIPSSSKP